MFYASVFVQGAGEERQVDARPSDAFALALRTGSPMYVGEELMTTQGIELTSNQLESAAKLEGAEAIMAEMRRRVEARVKKLGDEEEVKQLAREGSI